MKSNYFFSCRHLMDGQFELMRQEKAVAPEEDLAQVHEGAGSAAPEGAGEDEASQEVATTATGGMATEAMVTEASVVVTGALVVDTEVEDIPQVATGTTGDRVDMVIALDLIAMAMTAMVSIFYNVK
ncbi:hypothetical protein XENOCAPTIV_027933 [Xenoophorus captivus]|uniref:Uncharacterized protein n=1 Tax=Xenoophorus captivus TaxID=1517983 RepID=A0ABV0S3J4_9TELE